MDVYTVIGNEPQSTRKGDPQMGLLEITNDYFLAKIKYMQGKILTIRILKWHFYFYEYQRGALIIRFMKKDRDKIVSPIYRLSIPYDEKVELIEE